MKLCSCWISCALCLQLDNGFLRCSSNTFYSYRMTWAIFSDFLQFQYNFDMYEVRSSTTFFVFVDFLAWVPQPLHRSKLKAPELDNAKQTSALNCGIYIVELLWCGWCQLLIQNMHLVHTALFCAMFRTVTKCLKCATHWCWAVSVALHCRAGGNADNRN